LLAERVRSPPEELKNSYTHGTKTTSDLARILLEEGIRKAVREGFLTNADGQGEK
jgi:hypothetical protein